MAAQRAYSRPEFHVPVTLQSAHAHQVVGRSLIRVARALYGIDVVLHAIGDEAKVDEVEGVVDGLLGEFSKTLGDEIARLEALKTSNGISAVARYTNPSHITFRISSPQLAQYANLIQALDRLTMSIDTLWLSSLLSNRQRANAVYKWRKDLLALGRRIVEIEARARDFAVRKGKGEEIAAGDTEASSVVTVEGDEGLAEDDETAAD
jgi:hypothetical protein